MVEFKTGFAEESAAIEALGAFANALGGGVFFGVRPDGVPCGVTIGTNTIENFVNKLRRESQPPLSPRIDPLDIDGKVVVSTSVAAPEPGQLFHVFNRALVRVGRTNQVMSPEEQKARLRQAQEKWSEETDRPRFEVRQTSANSLETQFAPQFGVKQFSGDPVANLEWRIRGPRFSMDWRAASGSALERTAFTNKFDLTEAIHVDEAVGANEMGFEIRFYWRGRWRTELHRWPITRQELRQELRQKVLWDIGSELLPPVDIDWPCFEVEPLPPTPDNHVHLLVRNDGETQDFVADVMGFDNIEEPQQRYKMKWREDTAANPTRTIHKGADDVLDVAQITPPDLAPGGARDAYRRGSFWLFSVKLPGGWEVHAGQSGWRPAEEALRSVDPYDDTIALMIRVSGSSGDHVTKVLRLGFSRTPLSEGTGATVTAEDAFA